MELGAQSGIIDHATGNDEDACSARGQQSNGGRGLSHITRRTFRDINIFCTSGGYVIKTDVHAGCVDEISGENGEEGSANEE